MHNCNGMGTPVVYSEGYKLLRTPYNNWAILKTGQYNVLTKNFASFYGCLMEMEGRYTKGTFILEIFINILPT